NLLSKTDFEQLEALAARSGLPKSVTREFKASTLALMLDLSACAVRLPGTKPYLDELIANIARENKIETVGLESMIEQIEILDGLPRETKRDLLIAVLRRADRSEDFAETQIARYAEGDIGGLLAWLQSAEPIRGVAQAQIPPAVGDRLITLRNQRMRDRALSFLRRGDACRRGGSFAREGRPFVSFRDGRLPRRCSRMTIGDHCRRLFSTRLRKSSVTTVDLTLSVGPSPRMPTHQSPSAARSLPLFPPLFRP